MNRKHSLFDESSWYLAIREGDSAKLKELMEKYSDTPEAQLAVKGFELENLLEEFRDAEDPRFASVRILITGNKIVKLFSEHRNLLEHEENFLYLEYLVKANFLFSAINIIDMIPLKKFNRRIKAKLLFLKGIAFYRLGIYNEAINSLTEAIKFEETSDTVMFYTFLSLMEQDVKSGKQLYMEKNQEMSEAVRLTCEVIIKFYDEKFEEVTNSLMELWDRFGSPISELVYYRGMAYEKIGQFNEASKHYLAAFHWDNEFLMRSLISLIKLQIKLGEYKKAQYYTEIGAFLGDNTDEILLYGLEILRRLRNNKQLKKIFSEKDVKELISGEGDVPDAVIYALWILNDKEKWGTAEVMLLKAVNSEKLPIEWRVRAYEGLSLIAKKRKYTLNALEWIEKGLKLIPDDNELLFLKIQILIEMKQLKEAYNTYIYLKNHLYNKQISKKIKNLKRNLKN